MARKSLNLFDRIEKTLFVNAGVPYLVGKPGVGKSDVSYQIAEKYGMRFFDLRLTQIDSAEVGGIPKTKAVKTDSGEFDVMYYCIPEWAVVANQQPSIVIFDELNRAPKDTRDAALQIFNERRIGWNFKFNDNVHFIAAGNIGEADGTEVDALDSAMNGRLVHIDFNPTFEDWLNWAKNNSINENIISFLKGKPNMLYNRPEGASAYASPRSWSNFSKMLGKSDIEEVKFLNSELGFSYIGVAATSFARWLEEQTLINIDQIIDNFSSVQNIIGTLNRSKTSELVSELKSKDFSALNTLQVKNISEFLKKIDQDEVVGYTSFLMEKEFIGGVPSKNFRTLMNDMPEIKNIIRTTLGG